MTYKVNPGSDVSSKIIDFTVEEKPTGEILTGTGWYGWCLNTICSKRK